MQPIDPPHPNLPHPNLPRPDPLAWRFAFAGRPGDQPWSWAHYDLVNSDAPAAIRALSDIPDAAVALLLSADETPRLILGDAVVAGVLPTYARTGDADAYEVACWHFAMTPGLLVTARRRPSRTLFNLWDSVRAGLVPADPLSLLDLSICELVREVRARLALLARGLDPVEDRLIEARAGSDLTDLGRRLGAVRREAVRTLRMLAPLLRAFERDADDIPQWARFGDQHAGSRLLHGALDDLTALHDRCRSLQDELTTRLAEETNRRLYVVSIVTTVAVPATFITGFFGMNTGGLLWGGEQMPYGTLYATLLSVAAVGAALLLLRWKRLL